MFYHTQEFSFAKKLKENWEVIRDEFLENFDEKDAKSWPQKFIYTNEWKLVPLVDHSRMAQHGMVGTKEELDQIRSHFPRTVAVVDGLDGIVTAGFSRLTPKSVIHPHKGIDHTVLRSHLGLITPDNCALNCHGQVRSWSEGSVWLFDDTYAHEVWNESDAARVVLIMDFSKKALEDSVGGKLDRFLQERTPDEVERGNELETRAAEWQEKYTEEESAPDWEKIFDYEVEND
jgi:aspartyl/asparaginyl beta-hydroxylase (cupin superfamily)